LPELASRSWYESADMSKYIALIIDHLNHDASLSDLLDPGERISARIAEYKVKHTISDNYEM
jgi:ribose-phosphate pyrophosphokinase